MIYEGDAYKKIMANKGTPIQWIIKINDQSIPLTSIKAFPTIASALYTDEFSLGNVASSCFEMTYLPTVAPPRRARVDVSFKIVGKVDGATTTIIRKIGTWYINSRSTDKHGWLTIQCYDMVVRLDNYTVKKAAKKVGYTPLTYPLTTFDITYIAQELTGLAAPYPQLDDVASFTKDDLSQKTMREALGYAALQNGVNLICDHDMSAFKAQSWQEDQFDIFYLLTDDGNTGGERLLTHDGEPIVFMDWTNACQTIRPRWAGEICILGRYDPISAVKITGKESDDADNEWTADFNLFDGATMEIDYPFDNAGENVAYAILDKVERFPYTGWNATGVLFDPVIQVGDPLIVDGIPCVVAEIHATLGQTYLADCGAAADYEIKGEI